MANKMLIDTTHPEETRVVVLRGNRVEEFDFESANRRQLRGNIYLAKVTRVEPSLQAAFIDYGGNRHGFLAFSEIHPDYYQIPVADRQALIAEEERAHRDAEDEIDRRASGGGGAAAARAASSARTARSRCARSAERGHRRRPERRAKRRDAAQAQRARRTAHETEARETEASRAPRHSRTTRAPPTEAQPAPASPDVASGRSRQAAEQPAAEPCGRTAAVIASDAVPRAASAERSAARPNARTDAARDRARARPLHTESPDLAPDAERRRAAPATATATSPRSRTARGENGDEEVVESVGGADAMEEVQERTPRYRRTYKIQEVIKRRQIMLVQVVKEERGTKGAALTTYLSLAGRYSVLMPNTARGGGISRKITKAVDRKKLKEIAQDLEVPEGMGVILRTAGANRTKTEVKRDFEYLLRLWETVRDFTLKSTAPTLVYEEGSLIKRSIRDLYNKDIEEILVAGEDGHREATTSCAC